MVYPDTAILPRFFYPSHVPPVHRPLSVHSSLKFSVYNPNPRSCGIDQSIMNVELVSHILRLPQTSHAFVTCRGESHLLTRSILMSVDERVNDLVETTSIVDTSHLPRLSTISASHTKRNRSGRVPSTDATPRVTINDGRVPT